MLDTIERAPTLSRRRFANDAVTLAPSPPVWRLSVRSKDRDAANRALSMDLPSEPNRSWRGNGAVALWLGPDEWLVIGETNDAPAWPDGVAAVDVSHRNAAIVVSGEGAADALAAGCPRDLRLLAFPVGACARTILGKAEVVLLREDDDTFRVECWRSFAPYVWAFLEDAATGL